MENRLIRKLELFGPLPDSDKKLLDDIVKNSQIYAAHTDIISEGDIPTNVHLILEGFACRYKNLANGTRQIMAYMLPGDFCDLHVFVLRQMDHSIGTLSQCDVVDIPRPRILEMLERPALARTLWMATLVDEATLREWIVNMGRRGPAKRIGHLLCEINMRLKMVGISIDGRFRLPITQVELADTMGLSNVHVNRALMMLRKRDLITLEKQEVVILDAGKLEEFAGFTPNYLHFSGGKEEQSRSSESLSIVRTKASA